MRFSGWIKIENFWDEPIHVSTRIKGDASFLFFLYSSFSLARMQEGIGSMHYRLATAAVVLIPIKLFGSDTNLAVGRLPYDHDRSPPLRSSPLSLYLSPLPVPCFFLHILYTSFYTLCHFFLRHRRFPPAKLKRLNPTYEWTRVVVVVSLFCAPLIRVFHVSLQIPDPANRTTLRVRHPLLVPSLNVDRIENDPRLRFGSRSGKMIRATTFWHFSCALVASNLYNRLLTRFFFFWLRPASPWIFARVKLVLRFIQRV